MTGRVLILDAGMGAGHRAVATELSERFHQRGHAVHTVDVLDLLPPGFGAALRGGYRTAVRRAPWLYDSVYTAFLKSDRGPGSTPLAVLATRRLQQLVTWWRPDVVVPVFHLAAQATGRMRAAGALKVPSAVVITDFAVHGQWLHQGNDLHLCMSAEAAGHVSAALGRAGPGDRSVHPAGPIVPEKFAKPSDQERSRWSEQLTRLRPNRPAVLIGTGAWGVGSALDATARELAQSGYLPVVLCGHNQDLRVRLARTPGVLACGWIDRLDGLMAASAALVDNAAGQTAVQALAAGLPVVGHRPIAGHGRDGVLRMARIGVCEYAADPDALLGALAALARPGPARDRRIAVGRALFRDDPVDVIERAMSAGPSAMGDDQTDGCETGGEVPIRSHIHEHSTR